MSKKYDAYVWFYSGDDLGKLKRYFRELSCRRSKREKEITKNKNLSQDIISQLYYFKIKKSVLLNLEFKDDIRVMYKNYLLPVLDIKNNLDSIDINERLLEILTLDGGFWKFDNSPKYSLLVQIKFKLKKPYLSKDDDNFYIIDNPIVKEKVFKLPMVRATTWKGALRFAALKVFEEELQNGKITESDWKEKRALLVRLFGNEKDAMEKYLNKIIASEIKGDKSKVQEVEQEFEKYLLENGYISKEIPSRTGRLFFYPTFFDRISLDVITPLSRESKTPGRGPIYFETVPEGTKGIFRILYYPFDQVAKGEFEKIEGEMKEEIEFLSEAMRKMFCETGFSAKKSSGFGTAKVVDYKVQSGSGISNSISSKIEDTIGGLRG